MTTSRGSQRRTSKYQNVIISVAVTFGVWGDSSSMRTVQPGEAIEVVGETSRVTRSRVRKAVEEHVPPCVKSAFSSEGDLYCFLRCC